MVRLYRDDPDPDVMVRREVDPSEYVQRILNAGTSFKASPKAEFKESRKHAGVAVTYRVKDTGFGGKQLVGNKFYDGIR